jgi:hypothetical protein
VCPERPAPPWVGSILEIEFTTHPQDHSQRGYWDIRLSVQRMPDNPNIRAAAGQQWRK